MDLQGSLNKDSKCFPSRCFSSNQIYNTLQQDAETLLGLCEKTIIRKTRHEVSVGNHLFEVDEFEGLNAGLVIAEVELSAEDDVFSKPNWLGQEVTGDIRYYNSNLSKHPFCDWE